jgi:hypothetical protein
VKSTAFRTLFVAALTALLAACASSPRPPEAPPCAGFDPPELILAHPVSLPPSYSAARIGEVVISQVVIGRQGEVLDVQPWRNMYRVVAPYAELSLKKARFLAARIEGNPVASRCLVSIPVGTIRTPKSEPAYDTLWAYVPGGESREARWQLRDSVRRITIRAHVGSAGREAEIVARAPSGAERVLVRKTLSALPLEFQETVGTGDFFERGGNYSLELRVDGKEVASTTFTIADDAADAVVNACEPVAKKK